MRGAGSWGVLLVLALAVGCGDTAPGPTAPAQAEPPAPETGGERMGEPHPTGGGPVAPGPDGGAYGFETCVKECVRNRQMQAIPMEKIEADCQGECASDPD